MLSVRPDEKRKELFSALTDISSLSLFILRVGSKKVKVDTVPLKPYGTTAPEPKSYKCKAQMAQPWTISTSGSKESEQEKRKQNLFVFTHLKKGHN